MTSQRVGIVGLGLMGSAIADRLLDVGHEVGAVAHRRRERIEALVACGGREFATVADLVGASDAVILCLGAPAAKHMLPQVVAAARPEQTVVDCSTGDPDFTGGMAEAAARRGVPLVDAAILHSTPRTRAGKAVLLVGGSDDDIARARSLLEAFAERLIVAGPPGSGQRLKLFSNALVHSVLALTCELAAHAKVQGMDLNVLQEVFASAGASSKVVDNVMRAATADEHNPNAHIGNTLNAIRTYLGVARSANAHAPVVEGAYQAYRIGVGSGLSEDAITRLVDVLAEQNARLKS